MWWAVAPRSGACEMHTRLGLSSSSTEAKKASMSMWTQVCVRSATALSSAILASMAL